ncbi:MAG: exonuclease domain-containing protein [Rhodospirillaceae bacterium]
MDFVAVDVETANPNMASICQIGVARYSSLKLVEEWVTYVDPADHFDPVNVSIHGIDEETVRDAPLFPALESRLRAFVAGAVVVCHTHFDRAALSQAAARHKVLLPSCTWLDSARVARRAWDKFAARGYGLTNVCKSIGYTYRAHDALEDAKAAGAVMVAAITQTGVSLSDWLAKVEEPIRVGLLTSPNGGEDNRKQPSSNGPLKGEVIVFTGSLGMPRAQAESIASDAGCEVGDNVTMRTTILVVGNQDISALAGHSKSTKHRKAETLILKGQRIRILCEADFRELIASSRA